MQFLFAMRNDKASSLLDQMDLMSYFTKSLAHRGLVKVKDFVVEAFFFLGTRKLIKESIFSILSFVA